MTNYILNLNKQTNGDLEVHQTSCSYAPKSNVQELGYFNSCQPAVTRAKELNPYKKIDGCYHCSPTCHNS